MNAFHLEAPGAHLRYHDLPGDDPTLVFLHGLGSASSSAFPRVARDRHLLRHRALLVDLLGFGYSDRPPAFDYAMESHAESIVSLLRALGLDRTVLIGHSMGGSVAILVAAAAPKLVGCLIAAEANLDPGPGFVSGIITSVDERTFADTGHAQFVRRVLGAGYADYAGTAAMADPTALHRSAVSLIADRCPTYRERLTALPLPRTYLFGEHTLPDPDVDRLRKSGIDVRVVPAAGHDMMADNPDGFAAAVAAAIDAARLGPRSAG